MNARQTSIEELCSIAKDFLKTASEVRSTLEIMQASYNTVIDGSNVSSKEKETLKHIVKQVSPTGLNSLLDALELTVQRTRTLYTQEYERAASALASTILEQAGVAGPTGERTFNCKADGLRAATLEVPQQTTTLKPVVNKVATPETQTSKGTSKYTKYTQLLAQYPLLEQLNKKPSASPIHQWVQECGYNMSNPKEATSTLDKGMTALLWPVNTRTNAVSAVHALPHPCGKGTVYILEMEKPTTPELGRHLDIQHHAVWLPNKYPLHAIVEVSSDPEQVSRDCPFSRKRRGWEAIYSKLASLAELSERHEVPNTANSNQYSSSTKQQHKGRAPQQTVAR